MNNIVRIGVIGAGSISVRGILPHLTQEDVQDRVHVTAVCDPVPGRAQAAGTAARSDAVLVLAERPLEQPDQRENHDRENEEASHPAIMAKVADNTRPAKRELTGKRLSREHPGGVNEFLRRGRDWTVKMILDCYALGLLQMHSASLYPFVTIPHLCITHVRHRRRHF